VLVRLARLHPAAILVFPSCNYNARSRHAVPSGSTGLRLLTVPKGIHLSTSAWSSHHDSTLGALMIKKVAGGYKVVSEKGKNLGGPYKTKKEAEKRLKQVEYFKHHK
jgi:hypothetical protein